MSKTIRVSENHRMEIYIIDQDNEIDPVREQHRFYWKERHDFQTKPAYEEWATVVQQWEEKMSSVIRTTKNGTSEFLRLQGASVKCSLHVCNYVLTTVCCFRGPSNHWLGKGHIVTICSCINSAKEIPPLQRTGVVKITSLRRR